MSIGAVVHIVEAKGEGAQVAFCTPDAAREYINACDHDFPVADLSVTSIVVEGELSEPDEVFVLSGEKTAQWGQSPLVPVGGQVDPVPTVYSTPTAVWVQELRLSLEEAEKLADRLQAAVAYERGKGSTR
ncbi:hypothetical protein L3Q65_45860 [Amycolatopsis sp. FU40]|uniref:hypothetical protein n=1 Tax=Amycolatopsis sp. FU40 TaxID=2914159 RepID=UPI001F29149E|nr:hypothetical protein [Amycolatopsis sp. FU40]UKD55101.1 hypothetical protein L3Q65_45860 [Amycolatopsis sp. FU40]